MLHFSFIFSPTETHLAIDKIQQLQASLLAASALACGTRQKPTVTIRSSDNASPPSGNMVG